MFSNEPDHFEGFESMVILKDILGAGIWAGVLPTLKVYLKPGSFKAQFTQKIKSSNCYVRAINIITFTTMQARHLSNCLNTRLPLVYLCEFKPGAQVRPAGYPEGMPFSGYWYMHHMNAIMHA